ncbi:MAG: hypothetical protein M1828_004988 [Chrysothrix sp. TS-e1954]|nr:MAG: hypothetical protein M1828_004988 [Chrysothrix sp. TS-e1954]
MPLTLLPASAAAFAPRSAPTIVLASRVETWLTQTLKRINRVKRPLNSVPQHYRCLNETLSGSAAIWTLASIMVPKSPDSELSRDPSNPIAEAIMNYQMIHIEAYVVHIDMVSQNEIAYKLNQDTIDSLIEYHKDIYSVDVAANTWDWSEKEQQLKKLQNDFVQAVNRFVYRTHVRALEGLEEDGAGELLEGRSEEVKNAIMSLFLPLLPPPPRIVDVAQTHPLVQVSSGQSEWWQAPPSVASPQHTAPVDPWRVLGSSPSPSATAGESVSSTWSPAGYTETHMSTPEPYSQAFTTSSPYYSIAATTAPMPSVPLPLPSVLAQQCGSSATSFGYGGFAWTDNLMSPTLIPI